MSTAVPARVLAPGAVVLAGVTAAVAASWWVEGTTSSPLHPTAPAATTALSVGLITAFVAYAFGAWTMAQRPARLAAVLALAAAIQIAPVAAPLLLSSDANVYWDYGRIATVHHGNPYVDLPSRYPLDPAYSRMGADWHRTTSAYGPLWTMVGELDAVAAGDSHNAAIWIYKVLGGLAAVGLAAVAAAASRRPAFAAALVGWNPLLALHFGGGGHNDALMMGLVVGGLALQARRRPQLGGAAWAAAIAIKWLPLLLLPLQLLADRRNRRHFGYAGLLAGGVTIAVVSTALYGVHWFHAGAPISNQLQRQNSLSLVYRATQHGMTLHEATLLLGLAFVIAYLWLLVQAWRGRARLGLCAGLFALSLAWLTPWYAVWCIALAAIEDDLAAELLAVGLSAYLLTDALPL